MGSKVVMINDVAWAFFEAPAVRQVCEEHADEDKTAEDVKRDNVGHLNMSLSGARDAAMNWQEEVAKDMGKWGFRWGKYNRCPYDRPGSNLMTLVHGDDFVSVGSVQAASGFKVGSGVSFRNQNPSYRVRRPPGQGRSEGFAGCDCLRVNR